MLPPYLLSITKLQNKNNTIPISKYFFYLYFCIFNLLPEHHTAEHMDMDVDMVWMRTIYLKRLQILGTFAETFPLILLFFFFAINVGVKYLRYFIVGFLTTVNGQCQGPLKVAFLSECTQMRNSLTTLIRSLIVIVEGLAFYTASALCAEHFAEAGIMVNGDFVPFGYFVFLIGSFLMGTSAAMLQVVINPYIAAYTLPGTSTVQRMNFTCAVNSIGTTVAPLFVTGIMCFF